MDADKLLELRVTGVKEASARARLAFFIMIFGCGTILITLYNNYFQWNRINFSASRGLGVWARSVDRTASLPNPSNLSKDETDVLKKRADDLKDESDKQDARSQSDNEAISLPWLGIKLSSADLDALGAAGLFLTSMYYLLCVRRMALEIDSTLASITPDATGHDRTYIYLGVRQSFVLNAAVDEDLIFDKSSNKVQAERGINLSRWVFPKLTFLPVATILVNIASDWYYVFGQQADAFGSGWWWLQNLDAPFRFQLIVMNLLACLVAVGILILNLNTYRLQRGSVTSIQSFRVVAEARAVAAGS